MWPNWKSLETQDNMKNNQWREKAKEKIHQTQHTENPPPTLSLWSVLLRTNWDTNMKSHWTELHALSVEIRDHFCHCRGGVWGRWCPLSSVICRFLPLLIFPRIERTQVIHLNDKAGRGIQFVSHCTALCLSRVYCGIEVTWGGDGGGRCRSPGKPVTSTEWLIIEASTYILYPYWIIATSSTFVPWVLNNTGCASTNGMIMKSLNYGI